MTQKVRGEKASEQRARTRGDEKAVARKGTKPKAKATPKAKAPLCRPLCMMVPAHRNYPGRNLYLPLS
jgi:hypothetical protein